MKKLQFCILPIVLSGCTTSAYISSKTDPYYNISKADPIYFIIQEDKSIIVREDSRLIESELIKNNFNITPEITNSKYILIPQITTTVSEITGSRPVNNTAVTSTNINGVNYSGSTNFTTYAPYTESYSVKKIFLFLYSTDDIKNNKRISIWEGYIGANEKSFYKHSRLMIKELLSHFGKNYAEHTRIKINDKP